MTYKEVLQKWSEYLSSKNCIDISYTIDGLAKETYEAMLKGPSDEYYSWALERAAKIERENDELEKRLEEAARPSMVDAVIKMAKEYGSDEASVSYDYKGYRVTVTVEEVEE